ncbi:MAG: SpoVG family protein [Phycisphaerales bacterium]|nr:SpoVG family protein [Phycisphaerales bacterium]
MNITEVRVKMVSDGTERLRAFCSVTLDGAFVIRDLKIIDGSHGPFVAMPSRKLADRCPECKAKNHLRARYCNECGTRLHEGRAPRDSQGRVKLHADIAHPINADCREQIQTAVIEAFEDELELSKKPGYRPQVDDFDDIEEELEPVGQDDDDGSNYDEFISDLKASVENKRNRTIVQTAEPASHGKSGSESRISETAVVDDQPEEKELAKNEPPPLDEDDSFGAGIV